MFKAEYIVYR